jgi:hypothetical protein
MLNEPIKVVSEVVTVLQGLGITYAVGGSVASSIHGVPRATQDVDIIALMGLEHVGPVADALKDRFYLDVDALRAAVRSRGSINVIHLATMFKVDIFVPAPDAWIRSEMARARDSTFEMEGHKLSVRVASPEDALLHKLYWYKEGGEVSDRQWSDIQGIMTIQGTGLDTAYLDRWSPHLDVQPLLARARREHHHKSQVLGKQQEPPKDPDDVDDQS